MASSSSNKSCFHCDDSSSDSLKNGWDLICTDKFAQLCNACYSIYESGRWCETFHKEQPEWSHCEFCDKPIHCSCLVSFNEWFRLEHGVNLIVCMECSKVNSFLEQNFSNVMDLVEEIQSIQISNTLKLDLVPMFEILLIAGNMGSTHDSLVIPKKYAEAYLPEGANAKGIYLHAVEYTGKKEWTLRLRCWLDRMYLLDGLQDFMTSNNLQEGDTLTFYRLLQSGGDGLYVLGFRKAPIKRSPYRKFSTRGMK